MTPTRRPPRISFPMRLVETNAQLRDRTSWNQSGLTGDTLLLFGATLPSPVLRMQVITTRIRLNPSVNGTRYVYEGTYFSGAHGTNCLRRVVVEMAPGLGGSVDLMGILSTYAYKIP